MIYFCVKFQKDPLYGLNLTFFAPWLPWQRSPFWIFFNPPKAVTHYGRYSYKVLWSLMKGIQKKSLFCFHGNCGKVCSTDSDLFGLSRSTRCGCCSCQVPSISVRRVTCYDLVCVFQFFRIFVFWRPFLVQNGHHSKPKWSPYGAACLILCKYPFPLKSVHFWIFSDF